MKDNIIRQRNNHYDEASNNKQ